MFLVVKMFDSFINRFDAASFVPIKFAINSICRHIENFRPFFYAQNSALNFYKMIISSISSLLSSCCPSTISGPIVSVHIRESINGMFWGRSWAHIFVESFKATFPRTINFYSSTSVIFVIAIFSIVAPLQNILPNRKLT